MWKTLRIFVSSTFADMHAERSHLARVVFPELRERCARRGLHVTEVDLRWGVTMAEATDDRTLAICLDEIDLCRPYFIGLIGERYGSVLSRYVTPDEPKYEWLKECPPAQSITALEIYYGALKDRVASGRQLFYFRDPSFIRNLPPENRDAFESETPLAREKLEHLKTQIRRNCKVFENYPCRYEGTDRPGHGVLSGLEIFGSRVLEDLWTNISQDYPEDFLTFDESEAERRYHERFLETRSRIFVGRRNLLKSLTDYSNGERCFAMVVTGEPGQGKSALLSKFVADYRSTHVGSKVIAHFAGCSPDSRNIVRALSRLCRELAPTSSESLPEEYEPLRDMFRNRLEAAGRRSKVLLVIDGLNQMVAGTRQVSTDWIPKNLPTQVHMVLSTTPGDLLESMRKRRPAPVEIAVGTLSDSERAQLVRELLSQHRKRLNEVEGQDQLSLLLRKFDSWNALYLTVACEELRVVGLFSTLTKTILELPESVTELFAALLKRLEDDHGESFVRASLSALACSRGGLLETELIDLIRQSTGEPIPQLAWSRLYRGLDAYLQRPNERGEGLLNFFHEQLTQAVFKRYLPAPDLLREHGQLAAFFNTRADPNGDSSWKGRDPRAFEHLPYHLALANDRVGLAKILFDFSFLRAKTFVARIYSLIEDFDLPGAVGEPSLGLLAGAMRLSAGVIGQEPAQIAGQLIGRLMSRPQEEIRTLVQAARQWDDTCWLCPLLPELTPPGGPLVKLLVHDANVSDLAISQDGKRAVSASGRCVKVWDLDSGTCEFTLHGHTGLVTRVAMSADGRRAISASDDTTLTVWDLEIGSAIWRLPGHIWFARYRWLRWLGRWLARNKSSFKRWSVLLQDVDISDDGSRAISSSYHLIKVWDLDRGKEHCRFSGRVGVFLDTIGFGSVAISGDGKWAVLGGGASARVRVWDIARRRFLRLKSPFSWADSLGKSADAVDISSDGKRVIACFRESIAIWDLGQDGTPLQLLSDKTGWFTVVALTADGHTAITGSNDEWFASLQVWDANNGKELRLIRGSEGWIRAVATAADGNRVLTERDNTVEVWDLSVSSDVMPVPAHKGPAASLAVGRDERRGVSCSRDGNLKIWDLVSGKESRTLSAHSEAIDAVAITEDGVHAVSVARDYTLKIWDLETGANLRDLSVPKPRGYYVRGDPIDVGLFPVGLHDVIAVLHHVWYEEVNVLRLSTRDPNEPPLCWELKRHNGSALKDSYIVGVAVSDDGRWMISAAADNTVIVWDLIAGREYRRAKIFWKPGSKICLRISEHRALAVSTATDESVISVLDPLNGTVFHNLEGHTGRVASMAITPDFGLMTSIAWDRTCKLWDLNRGIALATFTTENDPHYCCISPPGHIICISDLMGSVQFLSVRGNLNSVFSN